MRRTREEAEKTRQTILDAALEIFSQQGFEAARLQDIADAAGVTRGAIYHHFKDKTGLLQKLQEEISLGEERVVDRAIAEGGNLVEIMTRILTYSLAQLGQDNQHRQTFLLSTMNFSIDPGLVDIHCRQIEQREQLVDTIASLVAQGIIMGELREDLDPMMLARAFVAYRNGVASFWLVKQQAFSLKEQAGELATIFMKGFLTG